MNQKQRELLLKEKEELTKKIDRLPYIIACFVLVYFWGLYEENTLLLVGGIISFFILIFSSEKDKQKLKELEYKLLEKEEK